MAKSDSRDTVAGFVGCATLLLLPGISVVSAFYHAWGVTILWQWFIEPHIHQSAPPYAVMVGISYIVALYRSTSGLSASDVKEEYLKSDPVSRMWAGITAAFIGPLFLLGIAWVVHHFIK